MKLLVSLCVATCLLAQDFERRAFSAEGPGGEHTIAMPDPILAKLGQDQDVTILVSPDAKFSSSWFRAAEVDLKEGERDVVVIGEYPVLGANVTTFWIFGPEASGFPLLLKVVAHTIQANNDRSHGYRNIVAMSVIGAKIKDSTFKFDGKRYSHAKTKTISIR
jgi:hypothetical protein